MKCVVFAAVAYVSAGADTLRMRGAAKSARNDSTVLPKVDSVMMPTHDALGHIVSDARKIEDFVAAQKEVVRAKLSTEKQRYEAAIAYHADANRRIYDRIQYMHGNITATLQLQQILRKQNEAIEASSNVMRSFMEDISPKLGVAEEFLARVDPDVPGLEGDEADALRPPPPEKTLEYYLNKSRTEMGLVGSLLQVSEPPTPQAAQGLVVKLVGTLERIAEAEKRSMEMLWEKFDAVNQSQAARHGRLVNQTKHVYQQWMEANATARELLVAKRHLNRTNMELQERVNSFMRLQDDIVHLVNDTLRESASASSDVKA